MKDKKDFIRIFLVCVIMLSLGFAFNMEEDHKYLPFMVFMAFVTLMFFLSVISQSNLKRNQQWHSAANICWIWSMVLDWNKSHLNISRRYGKVLCMISRGCFLDFVLPMIPRRIFCIVLKRSLVSFG